MAGYNESSKRPAMLDLLLKNREAALFFFERRFVKRKNGCWEWRGAILSLRGGYGMFVCRPLGIYPGIRSNRAAYVLYNGVMLKPTEHVLHRCDNPRCVNPAHLFVGDHKKNMEDKIAKGRQNKGSSHGMSKLTEEQVLSIFKDTRLYREIAEEHGISVPTVSDIKRGYSWSHLTKAVRL
jgi:hypothetical protein